MPGKRTGKPNGRPPALTREDAAKLARGEVAPEAMAKSKGAGRSTAYRYRAAALVAPKAPRKDQATPLAKTGSEPATGRQEVTERGTRDTDPLATLDRVQESIEDMLLALDAEQVVFKKQLADLVVRIAKDREGIRRKRPPPDDEQARWARDRDAVLRKIRAKLPEILAARAGLG